MPKTSVPTQPCFACSGVMHYEIRREVLTYKGQARTIPTLGWWCTSCDEAILAGAPLDAHEKAYFDLKAEVDGVAGVGLHEKPTKGQDDRMNEAHIGSTLDSFLEEQGLKEEVELLSLETRAGVAMEKNECDKEHCGSKVEVMRRIEEGQADAMSVSNDLIIGEHTLKSHYAVRFHDRALGEAVRQHTMKGFGIKKRK